jgi:methyl-accepting chemotaxis protein
MLASAYDLVRYSDDLQKVIDGFVMEIRLTGMSSEDVIAAAKEDHKAFKKKIYDAINGNLSLSADNLADHHKCRLGRWYDKAGDLEKAQMAFQQLADPHRLVHGAGKQALQLLEERGAAATRNACAELDKASEDVLRLLDDLGTQVRSAQKQGNSVAA